MRVEETKEGKLVISIKKIELEYLKEVNTNRILSYFHEKSKTEVCVIDSSYSGSLLNQKNNSEKSSFGHQIRTREIVHLKEDDYETLLQGKVLGGNPLEHIISEIRMGE